MAERKIKVRDSNSAQGADETDEITTETRELSPAHYVFKIEFFSQFSKNKITMHETNEFEVGDKKWRLILYPHGDKSKKGEDHVSLYLAVSQSNPLEVGEEIYATVRFFVFDQIRDEYLIKEGKNRRFHAINPKWGIPKFMPLKIFTDSSNGYLVDDTCVLGAEVFVINNLGVGERLTLRKSATTYTHQWKISRLSSLKNESFSDVFTAGDHKWKLKLHPRVDSDSRDKNLSIFLVLVNASKLTNDQKLNTRFTFRLKDRNNVVHCQKDATVWMSKSASTWGWHAFMPLKTVRAWGWPACKLLRTVPECLVDDPCVIEADVTVRYIVSQLP